MAIREFGESLLADVRARKDQQASDERKRERKAERSQLKGAVLGFIAKEGFGILKNNMERKTQDFLANSNLWANKLKQNDALKIVDKQMTYINAAKEASLTLPGYFLRENAKQALLFQQVNNPNSIPEGTEEEWQATFMQRQGAIDYSQEQANFANATKVSGDEIVAGRTGMTLEKLGSRQRPATLTASLFDRLRGREITNIETFNTKMELTKQVVAANSILDQQIALAESFAARGNLFLAKLTAPEVSGLLAGEQERIKELVANGIRVTSSEPVLKVVDRNLYQITQEITTDGAGNVSYGEPKQTLLHKASVDEVDGARIKQLKLNARKTQNDMIKQSVDMVGELYSEAAQEEFATLLSEKFNNTEDLADDDGTLYSSLMLAAATGKFGDQVWLKEGQRRTELSAQEIAVIGSPYKTELDALQSIRTSFLLVAEDTTKNETARGEAMTSADKIKIKMSVVSGNFVQAIKDRETEVYGGEKETNAPTEKVLGSVVVAKQNGGEFFISNLKGGLTKYEGTTELEADQEYFKIGDSLNILKSVEDPATNTIIRSYMIGKVRHVYDQKPISGAGG